MAEEKPHLFVGIQQVASRLAGDARGLIADRLELARLEWNSSARAIRRLLYVLIPSVTVALLSLPLLAVALAISLDGWRGVPASVWMLSIAVVSIALALASAAWAYRRFRRQFRGLEETLEELREDLVWLREWTGTADTSDEANP